MIVMQGVNGQSGYGAQGLGAFLAPLVEGVDFNCTKKACYGIGTQNHRLFEDLQSALNKFSAEYGFRPIPVDGFIGILKGGTVEAAGIVGARLPLPWTALSGIPLTIESIAANAPAILNDLVGAATDEQLPPVPPPKVVTPEEERVRKETARKQEEAARQTALVPKEKSNILWWILGGVALFGIGTVGYLTYKRRQEGGSDYTTAKTYAGWSRY